MAEGLDAYRVEMPDTPITRDIGRLLVGIEAAQQLGAAARLASAALSEIDQWSGTPPLWAALTDAQTRGYFGRSLYTVLGVLDRVPQEGDPIRDVLAPDAQARLDRNVEFLEGTLPFTGPERLWLVEQARDVAQQPGDPLDNIAGRTGIVVSSGQRLPVSGDELLQRWWDWALEVRYFFGYEDGHMDAMSALEEMATGFGYHELRPAPSRQDYVDIYNNSQKT